MSAAVQETLTPEYWSKANQRPRRAKTLLIALALLFALLDGPALAEEFTFRRVGVPSNGSSNRITAQIAVATPSHSFTSSRASEQQPAQVEPVSVVPRGHAAARMAGVDWFWKGVSPLLSDARSGRLEEAFAVITDAPPGEVVPPQRQALQELAHLYGADILRLTAGTSVSPDLVLAVLAVESAGRAESIRGGVAYLDWLLNHFEYDPILALAAYNAGEGAVQDNGGVPPYAETRAYVPKVLATWAVAQDLCKTPVEVATRGCGFMVAGL
jgi:soluble lytic murein transglycosylase-like protein